ncbi:B22R-like protein [Deerpox virus W-848-83]|uniref:B22R-like protein n=1 Tax=Deerpox virus (strain Mule deer/United States/W-848-83/1983) TaxID=305674 RepID=Q08FK6_DPV83|nr:Variola virus B22R-like protein [Deerpox virus W-848-83]ABI99301.1 B22R-like protein [Deerpox virus W-848-83]
MKVSFIICIFILQYCLIKNEELQCYRKLALYSFYDDQVASSPVIFKESSSLQNFDDLIFLKANELSKQINWTKIIDSISDEFKSKCMNSSDTLYNSVLTDIFTLTINDTIIDEDIFNNESVIFYYTTQTTNIIEDTNCINNNTNCTKYDENTFNNSIVTFNESFITISLENMTIILNNTCDDVSIHTITIMSNYSQLLINVTSDTISTNLPFLKSDMFNNCTLTQLVTIIYNNETIDLSQYYNNTERNIYNETIDLSKYYNDTEETIIYVQRNRSLKNLCDSASMETKVQSIGIIDVYNQTLVNMSIIPNNETAAYYLCVLSGTNNCGIDIFVEAASKYILEEENQKQSKNRRKRSINMELDEFCLHRNYDLTSLEDCTNTNINNKAIVVKNIRKRRSPPGNNNKPPVPSKGNLVLQSADELGARPKIRSRVKNIQVGAHGTDGSVSGSEEIYSNVKSEISEKIKRMVITSKGDLTPERLPSSTRALIGSVIQSKIDTVSESEHITKQLIEKQKPDATYAVPMKKGIIVEAGNRPSSLLDVDTSSKIYTNTLRNRGDTLIKTKNRHVRIYEEEDTYFLRGRLSSSGSEEDTYFMRRTPSSSSDDTYFLKESDNRVPSPSTTYSLPNKPKIRNPSSSSSTYNLAGLPQQNRNPSSLTYDLAGLPSRKNKNHPPENYYESIDDEHVYESINDPVYSLAGNPKKHVDRSTLPVPPLPNENKKKKMIDMICESKSRSSICNVRNFEESLYESIDDDQFSKRNSLYDTTGFKRNSLYDTAGGDHFSKRNSIYESIDDVIYNDLSGHQSLVRKNAMKKTKKQLNTQNEEFVITVKEDGNNDMDNMDINNNNNNNNHGNNNNNKRKEKTNKKLNELSVYDNKMDKIVKTIALSTYLSSTNTRISSIMAQAHTQPKELTIVNIISSVLTQLGGTLAIGGAGSPKAAVAGLALQGIAGLIDAATSIYFLLSGEEPPKDPAIEKFSNYASYVSQTDAGARVCMMPDSDITITLAYRHNNMNNEAEKVRGEYTDTIPSKVYYLRNNQISYTVKITLVCPIGQLRLFEADVNNYATLLREDKNGVKYYLVHGILELLSYHPNVTFTCGNEPGVIFMPFDQSLSDMQLLRISTPGEPYSAREMPSNVCDLYPLKKFYVLAGNCPYDMSRISVTYVTCNTLLRMSTYDYEKNRWILMNPFSRTNEDYIQLFTFSKYDFSSKSDTINLNTIGHSGTICSQFDTNTCYWADSMILEDVTSCNSRIRKLHVELAVVSDKGYNSFVLNCPYGSTPFHISNGSIIEIPMNTRRTSVRFLSQSENVALISCIHNSNPIYKSDIIKITFKKSDMSSKYLDFKNFNDRKYLFDSFSDIMPKRSKTCKRYSENKKCKNYYQIKHHPEIDYKVVVVKTPMVRLTTSYSGPLNEYTLANIRNYYSSPIQINLDVSSLSNVYKNPDHFWTFALKNKRTFSSIVVTLFPCSVVAGNIDVNYGIHSKGNYDRYGRNGKYMFIGSKDSPSNKRINFNFVKDHINSKLENEFGKCDVHLDLESRLVKVSCPEFTIPQRPFDSNDINSLCVLVTTSRDHCAISEEAWSKNDRTHGYGYSYEESNMEFNSCVNGKGTRKPLDNFCYYWYLGTYWAPDYDPCASSMVLGYSPVFLENKLVKPPYIKEFGYNPGNNEYVNRDLYNRLQHLYDNYNKLVMYSLDPVVEMSNEFAKSMTKEGREIFRLIADSKEIQTVRKENELKAEKIRDEIEKTLNDIYVNTLTYSETTELLRSSINTRCCVLNGTDVYKYFTLEYYLCGTYDDYRINVDNKTYIKINNTLIEEDIYLALKIPQVTCFQISLISVNNEESQKNFETEIVRLAFEDVLNDLFKEIDNNKTLYFISFENERRNVNKINEIDKNLILSISISLAITVVSTIAIILIIKRSKYKMGSYNINTTQKPLNNSSLKNTYVSLIDFDEIYYKINN